MCGFSKKWDLGSGDYVSASRARGAFRELLQRHCSPDSDLDGAEIIFGELLTNALRYSGGDATVEVHCHGPQVFLDVRDCGHGFDLDTADEHRSGDAEGGRGLMIARRLSTDLRVDAGHAGCVVQAGLPVTCTVSR
ncbi:MAG: ATP-binding protein [Candidatus Eremiobacteraeota bacterium]|nr:ATP-binding protein [Candidatus Eremiobacteraeota bacterium]